MKNYFSARRHQQPHQGNVPAHLVETAPCDAQGHADSQDGQSETQPTSGFAADLDVKPQTVRKQHSKTGSYLGIRPVIKLPNGRLRWPLHPVRLLAKGGAR
jgi:hypothetical protein